MTRIGVITDVHGNLPALQAALAALDQVGCQRIYHLGDAIGIGPFPAECVELLQADTRIRTIMGNHDARFVQGLPDPPPSCMDAGELAHHRWTHAQLSSQHRSIMERWPHVLFERFEDVRVVFTHYGLDDSGENVLPAIIDPSVVDLDGLFAGHDADVIFYGHHHLRSDIQGKARYVNPGSLGCHAEVARFAVLEYGGGGYAIRAADVPYDWDAVVDAFRVRDVPEKEFICRTFFHTEVTFETR